MGLKWHTITGFPVSYGLTTSGTEVLKWAQKMGTPTEITMVDLGGTYQRGCQILVWINKNQSKEDILDTAIHESVHVFQKLCEYIGEETPSAEFEAYTIANIAKTLMKEFEANAIHEERKARLQTRGGEVHLEAGSSEEANGTERSTPGDGEGGESP